MHNTLMDKVITAFSLLFILLFFFVAEWRWQILLLDFPDIRPHILIAFFALITIVSHILNMQQEKYGVFNWMALSLIIYLILVEVINLLYDPRLITIFNERNGILGEIGLWCIAVALFMSAASFSVWSFIYNHSRLITFMFLIYVAFPLFVLLLSGHAIESHFELKRLIIIAKMEDQLEFGVAYQSFGDKLAILSFIILSIHQKKWQKVIIFLMSTLSLYSVGSKASMVGYIFTCFSYLLIYLYTNKHYVKCTMIVLLSLSLLATSSIYIVGNDSLLTSNNWLIRTLARGPKDVSVASRHIIEQKNQMTRSSRVILGDYKFDYKLGRPGSYTHNALGIIDYYGLPIFITAVAIWLYLLLKSSLTLGKTPTPLVRASLMSMLFYTLLFIIARFPPVFYVTFWILGMAACATSHQAQDFSQIKILKRATRSR